VQVEDLAFSKLNQTSGDAPGCASEPMILEIPRETLMEEVGLRGAGKQGVPLNSQQPGHRLPGALIMLHNMYNSDSDESESGDDSGKLPSGYAHIFYSPVDGGIDLKHHLKLATGCLVADVKVAIGSALAIDTTELAVNLKDTSKGNFVSECVARELPVLANIKVEAVQNAIYESASTEEGVTVPTIMEILRRMPEHEIVRPVEEPAPNQNNNISIRNDHGFHTDVDSSDDDNYARYSIDGEFYEVVIYNFSDHVMLVQSAKTVNDYSTQWKPVERRETVARLPPRGYAAADRHHTKRARAGDAIMLQSYSDHLDQTYYVNENKTQVIIITQDRQLSEDYNTFQVFTGDIPEGAKIETPKNRISPGVYTLPIYNFCGRIDDLGDYLFDAPVDQRSTVFELKTQLLGLMNAEERFASQPAHFLRVCEMDTGIVFTDDDTVGQSVGGLLKGDERLFVCVLETPETKTKDHIVINVFQYYPSTFTTDGPGQQRQILLQKTHDNKYFLDDEEAAGGTLSVITALSEIVDVPKDKLNAAWSRVNPEGTIIKETPTGTALDMEKIWWSTMPASARQGNLAWVRGVKENDVFYFKDMREKEADLTEVCHMGRRHASLWTDFNTCHTGAEA
jgi:hypothetical protein